MSKLQTIPVNMEKFATIFTTLVCLIAASNAAAVYPTRVVPFTPIPDPWGVVQSGAKFFGAGLNVAKRTWPACFVGVPQYVFNADSVLSTLVLNTWH